MSTIGHNRRPLVETLFVDTDVSIEEILEAVRIYVEGQHRAQISNLSESSATLAANKDRLPETLSDNEITRALDLLSKLSEQDAQIVEQKEILLKAAKALVSELEEIAKPMSEGLSALEKALRCKLTDAYVKRIDAHNAERSELEPQMTSLTLRSSSGAKATLTFGEEIIIIDPTKIPRMYLIPDPKLLAAAIKKGQEVPGVDKKRKPSLRISA